jgi:DNA helicase HerA-like ATPase
MHEFERLGYFYLGRRYDLVRHEPLEEPILYDSRDLTTHAVCVGMTGSGKTGLCIALLEEAAIDGIPAIAIDPKGDLGNLLLTFPDLSGRDFAPWIDPAETARSGRSPEEQSVLVAEAACRMGPGRSANRSSPRHGGNSDLYTGKPGWPASRRARVPGPPACEHSR